jgi:cyclic pyranopterin phosphate synthase
VAADPVPLVDSFARRVKDLRISITDRCNFRCSYCMPAEGMAWLERSELLTYEEQARVARLCVERWGFEAIRVTGGEPTVRAHLPRLFELLRPLGVDRDDHEPCGSPSSRTTSRRRAPAISVSLDSLRPTRSRRSPAERPRRVLAGIDAALDAGLDPVKVNSVVIRRERRRDRRPRRVRARQGVGLRFIEFMPLDAEGAWSMEQGPRPGDPRSRRRRVPARGRRGSGDEPATGTGTGRCGDVSVIPSVTEPFCDHCDRVRVTAEGKFGRACSRWRNSTCGDPPGQGRRRRRRRRSDRQPLASEIERAVGTKWAGHRIGQVNFVRPARSMSQIGG